MTVFAFQQNRFIFIVAGLMLLAAACYFSFRITDGAFLGETEALGKVTGKEYIPFHEKYEMQNIGGINRTVKIAVPDTWLLDLDLAGAKAQVSVPTSEYNSMAQGEQVRVKYKKRRLSGNLQVTQYLGRAGG